MALLGRDHKVDVAVERRHGQGTLQVDAERVEVTRRQGAGRHVKDPLTIAIAESRRRETQRAA